MSKVGIGDYVFLNNYKVNGTIIGDRGGYVGRWTVKTDAGSIFHASSRDITVIKSARPVYRSLTANDKIDLLLEHLGLEILDEPKLVKRDEKTSNQE